MIKLAMDIWMMFRWRAATLVVLMCVNALLEGTGMALLIPFLATLGIGGSGGKLGQELIGILAFLGITPRAWSVGLVLLFTFTAQYSTALFQAWLSSHIQANYLSQIRHQLMHATLSARWGFFQDTKNSTLLNIIYSETSRASVAAASFLNLSAAALCSLIYITLALTISWKATVLLISAGGVLAFASMSIIRKGVTLGNEIGIWSESMLGWLTEAFSGMKSLKAQAAEQYVGEVFDTINTRSVPLFLQSNFLPGVLRSVMEGGAVLLLVATMIICSFSGFDFASLLVLMALFVRLYPRLSMLHQGVQTLKMYLVGLENVQTLLVKLEGWKEPSKIRTVTNKAKPCAPQINVTKVSIKYGEALILNKVTLSILPGTIAAIVGASGAGKTTLLDSILGLAEPTHGSIFIDGEDLSLMPVHQWRAQIGYVGQDNLFFNTTIQANIRWGRKLSQEDIHTAARLANAEEFILAQPSGYETVVGDQGLNISGGQRQRLALARALAGKPRLLVLDEATSALDPISERAIFETIQQLRGSMTILMVSHRVSSLNFADSIFVFDNGCLKEQGSFNTLLNYNGFFSQLCR